jgi:hypothetical protein
MTSRPQKNDNAKRITKDMLFTIWLFGSEKFLKAGLWVLGVFSNIDDIGDEKTSSFSILQS